MLDIGKRSIIVRAADDYRADERAELEVLFADGKAPARAAFALVMDPAEVDTRIDVERPEPPTVACPAEAPLAAPRPEDFVRLGFVSKGGVQTAAIARVEDSGQGLESERAVSYRGKGWVLFDVRDTQPCPSARLFSPHSATLTGKGGETLRVLRVTV